MEPDEIVEEEQHKETLEAIGVLTKKYTDLFGSVPSNLSISDLQDKIAEEMRRRDLRPFKL